MTAFGLLLLPFCLLAALRPLASLRLVLIASTFEAAAALSLGGLGLQPAMLPSVVFSGFMLLQILLGARFAGQGAIVRPLLPIIVFTVWALLSTIILPHVFEGQVSVNPQKLEPPFAAILLNPSVPRLNQNLYLVVDVVMLCLTALFTSGSTVQPMKVLQAHFVGGYLAVFIGLWQLASKTAGVPFPDDFFYSNPGWTLHSGQQVGLVPRINGPFPEPAAYAGYLVSIVCSTGWMALNGPTKLSVRILLGLALIMVVLSTSTTGYGVLAIFAALVPTYAAFRGSLALQRQVVRLGIIICLALTLIGLTTTAFFPAINAAAGEIFTGTINKEESESYQERSAADRDSLELAVHTFGLGAGWGANRSSSLAPGILSNVGVFGLLCLLWFGLSVGLLAARAARVMRDPDDRMTVRGATGAVLGSLVAALLSGPSITGVAFYVLIGIIVGTSARALIQARNVTVIVPRGARPHAFAARMGS